MPYCNSCGAQYNIEGTTVCHGCGAVLPRMSTGVPTTASPKKASNPAARRFAAGLVDLAISVALFASLFSSRRMLLMVVFRRGLALTIPHLYLLLKDSIEGKSIGKLLTGVMVLDDAKRKPGGLLDSIIRNWYLAIPFVGPTLIAVVIGAQILSGQRQRMGDAGAGTTVIEDTEYQSMR